MRTLCRWNRLAASVSLIGAMVAVAPVARPLAMAQASLDQLERDIDDTLPFRNPGIRSAPLPSVPLVTPSVRDLDFQAPNFSAPGLRAPAFRAGEIDDSAYIEPSRPALRVLRDAAGRILNGQNTVVDVPEAHKPGYLGVVGDDRNMQGRGIAIISVRPGSAAQAAGIEEGDVITAINGQPMKNLDALTNVLIGLTAGERVTLEMQRAGKPAKISVVLGPKQTAEKLPMPRDLITPGLTPAIAPPAPAGKPSLGVRVFPISDELRYRYSIVPRTGAVIDSIVRGSPADIYGLPIGGVIVAVDGSRVDSPDDLAGILSGLAPGREIEITYYVRDLLTRKKVRIGPAGAPVATPSPMERSKQPPPEPMPDDTLPAPQGVGPTLVPPAPMPPAPAAPAPATPTPVAPSVDVAPGDDPSFVIRRQMAALRGQIEQLQQQLDALQGKLDALSAPK